MKFKLLFIANCNKTGILKMWKKAISNKKSIIKKGWQLKNGIFAFYQEEANEVVCFPLAN